MSKLDALHQEVEAKDMKEAKEKGERANETGPDRSHKEPRAHEPNWPHPDPNTAEPSGCTVEINGIPQHETEAKVNAQLLTAFYEWPSDHKKIIGSNWMQEPNPQSSPYDLAYRYEGKGFIRFSKREYAQEYIDAVNGKVFIDPEGQKSRQVSVVMAERDLEFKINDRPVGPKYYDEIWNSCESAMKDL